MTILTSTWGHGRVSNTRNNTPCNYEKKKVREVPFCAFGNVVIRPTARWALKCHRHHRTPKNYTYWHKRCLQQTEVGPSNLRVKQLVRIRSNAAKSPSFFELNEHSVAITLIKKKFFFKSNTVSLPQTTSARGMAEQPQFVHYKWFMDNKSG